MALTLSEKIIKEHLVSGEMVAGKEITVKLDQCLLQDATGTFAWLEFEAMGVDKVKPSLVVQYIDHNLLQVDNKNMDDHEFLKSIAPKFGAHVSAPGNGISHHVHKERFTKPGEIMIGCDSHTPTAAGGSMIAIGVGGMDVAVGMATGNFSFNMPSIVGVKLTGRLNDWCTAKDVILEVLQRIGVKGGKGKILEYFGPGVETLDVSERSTIGNMGAETGATTTVFPSDERTREFFCAQKREGDWKELSADEGCTYSEVIEIDLGAVEPLIACPYSPGNVKPVREVAGIEVGQAMVGSSTNSSYEEMMRSAKMIDEMKVSKKTTFHAIPGSRQLLSMLDKNQGLFTMIKEGVRISEPGCNACIGMGNAPGWGVVSVRSFPRNWKGRSGTAEDQVFLSSVETATASAIKGEITDPRDLGMAFPKIESPREYLIDDGMIIKPTFSGEVKRGPNIKALPEMKPVASEIKGKVLLKAPDDISTDHILPAGAKVLPFRSNLPAISEFVFYQFDPEFVKQCKESNGGIIVGRENYGQGSSREHAAAAPMHLGIKAVIVCSFARIHRSNLINFGIVPLEFASTAEYDKIEQGDELLLEGVRDAVASGTVDVTVKNVTKGVDVSCKLELSPREKDLLLCGGLLNYTKEKMKQGNA